MLPIARSQYGFCQGERGGAPSDIVRWLQEDQQADERTSPSREILLVAGRKRMVSTMLYATCHYDTRLLHISAFAGTSSKSREYDGGASVALVRKLSSIVKICFPSCIGMLAEVSEEPDHQHQRRRLARRQGSARSRLFHRLTAHCGLILRKVPISYRMPDLTGAADPSNEKPMALLFSPTLWNADDKVPAPPHLVRFAYFAIYAGCFTEKNTGSISKSLHIVF